LENPVGPQVTASPSPLMSMYGSASSRCGSAGTEEENLRP
jgi:hypothetical protein